MGPNCEIFPTQTPTPLAWTIDLRKDSWPHLGSKFWPRHPNVAAAIKTAQIRHHILYIRFKFDQPCSLQLDFPDLSCLDWHPVCSYGVCLSITWTSLAILSWPVTSKAFSPTGYFLPFSHNSLKSLDIFVCELPSSFSSTQTIPVWPNRHNIFRVTLIHSSPIWCLVWTSAFVVLAMFTNWKTCCNMTG